jgi:hypothetical protein
MTASAIPIASSIAHPDIKRSVRPDRAPLGYSRTDRVLRRPDGSVLNESIPVFFVGRNRDGFWVARDAGGRIGGLFLLERSALAFAHRNCLPAGCAIVLPREHFELDVANDGNPLISWIGSIKRLIRPASRAARR